MELLSLNREKTSAHSAQARRCREMTSRQFEIDECSDGFRVFDRYTEEYVSDKGKHIKFSDKKAAQQWICHYEDIMKWAKQEKII